MAVSQYKSAFIGVENWNCGEKCGESGKMCAKGEKFGNCHGFGAARTDETCDFRAKLGNFAGKIAIFRRKNGFCEEKWKIMKANDELMRFYGEKSLFFGCNFESC